MKEVAMVEDKFTEAMVRFCMCFEGEGHRFTDGLDTKCKRKRN